ncbi:MAG: putative sulfate exporter family transporter [Pseudomonadales bacterium]|nr:putative sulfate exporter family transporter [Pseudomonadales bacterium]
MFGPRQRLIAGLLPLPLLIWLGNPAIGLLAGATIALATNVEVIPNASRYSKLSLQTAIVLLGFGLTIGQVVTISRDYSLIVSGYVLITLALGLALGYLIRVEKISSLLVTSGTAICGGTTVASLSPVVGARADQTAVTLALIFLLNSLALFLFPLAGEALALSQQQFGLWCALAIHDTSSVIATAAIYGNEAASLATTVKLGRTLWLIPLLLVASIVVRKPDTRLRVPGFILWFLAASVFASFVSLPDTLLLVMKMTSKALLVVALYLIGFEINRDVIVRLRSRAIVQGLILWAIVVGSVLWLVMFLG